ncbi:flagellar basal body-associated FliL family protein [Actibacterium sp. D379-3]
MAKLLPLFLALIGLAIGAGAGFMLRPDPAPAPADGHDSAEPAHAMVEDTVDAAAEFVKLNNQFVVPVMEHERVGALVVLSLSLEVAQGERAAVYQMEPKLRDAFLSVMFDHANAGGFKGVFTASTNMTALRLALLEAAQKIMGPIVRDVLITDLVRQDSR